MAMSKSNSMKLAMNLFEKMAKDIEISRQNNMDVPPSVFLIDYLMICVTALSKLTEAVTVIDQEYLRNRYNQIMKSETDSTSNDQSTLDQND